MPSPRKWPESFLLSTQSVSQSESIRACFLSGSDGAVWIQAEVLWRRPRALLEEHVPVLPELRGARTSHDRVWAWRKGPNPDLHRWITPTFMKPLWKVFLSSFFFFFRSHWGLCSLSVIPQHSTDSFPPSSSTVPNGEDLNAAAYYERLKILRQRRGLENSTVCLLLTWVKTQFTVVIDSFHFHIATVFGNEADIICK